MSNDLENFLNQVETRERDEDMHYPTYYIPPSDNPFFVEDEWKNYAKELRLSCYPYLNTTEYLTPNI